MSRKRLDEGVYVDSTYNSYEPNAIVITETDEKGAKVVDLSSMNKEIQSKPAYIPFGKSILENLDQYVLATPEQIKEIRDYLSTQRNVLNSKLALLERFAQSQPKCIEKLTTTNLYYPKAKGRNIPIEQ